MSRAKYFPLILITTIWLFLRETFIRYEFPSIQKDFFKRNKVYIITGILLFIIALFYRSWENLTQPGLYVEDAFYFNRYYGGNQPFSMVWNNFHGYITPIVNIYAWLVSKVDVRIQPGLYLLFAIIIGITTAVNLNFSVLFKSRLILLVAPLVLGLTGMNHIFYYNTLVYQFYTTVLLLLCLLFYPAPRSKSGLAGMSILFCILPWSGPYSVLAIPVGVLLLLFFRDGKKGFLIVIMIISTLFYYGTVNSNTIMLGNIFEGRVISYYYEVLFKEIFFFGYLGDPTIAKAAIFLFCLMLLFYLQRKDKICIKLSLVFLVLTVGALAPYFLSLKVNYNKCGACYMLISYFFWLVFLLYNLDKFLLRNSLKHVKVLFVFLFLVLVAVDNYPRERKKVVVNEGIPAFVDAIHHYEQLDLKGNNIFIKLQFNDAYANFKPRVIIGSRKRDAMQVGADYFKIPYGRQFIINPTTQSDKG